MPYKVGAKIKYYQCFSKFSIIVVFSIQIALKEFFFSINTSQQYQVHRVTPRENRDGTPATESYTNR